MVEPLIGSDFYYAMRFARAAPQATKTLWALFQSLNKLHPPYIDESIATVKLQWWQEEIDRTFLEIPEHPLTRALLPVIQTAHLSKTDFQTLLQAHAHQQHQPEFSDWDSLRLFSEQKVGSELSLLSQILGYPSLIPSTFSRHLGVSLFMIEKIATFGRDLQAGHYYFPQADLDFFDITPAQLFNRQCPASSVSSLLLRQSYRARQHHQSALAALPMVDRYSQLPLLILANLQLALLGEIERDNFEVLHHTLQLTPLRKCWIAWRTSRTETRRSKHGNRRFKTRLSSTIR